jgi:hypothetical protein
VDASGCRFHCAVLSPRAVSSRGIHIRSNRIFLAGPFQSRGTRRGEAGPTRGHRRHACGRPWAPGTFGCQRPEGCPSGSCAVVATGRFPDDCHRRHVRGRRLVLLQDGGCHHPRCSPMSRKTRSRRITG